MKKILIKAGVLVGVFLAAVIVFSGLMNREEVDAACSIYGRKWYGG